MLIFGGQNLEHGTQVLHLFLHPIQRDALARGTWHVQPDPWIALRMASAVVPPDLPDMVEGSDVVFW